MAAPFAVGFDIDHTLAIDNKLERVAFLHVLERIANDGGSALGSLADEIERIDALLSAQRSGAYSIEEAVNRFVSARGVSPDAAYIDGFKRMALEMVDTFIVPAPDAKRTLDELARHSIPTAVLSNGWNPLQIAKARRAGFGGAVVASGDIGVQKPNPRAFRALTDALGVDAAHCYYIGDDPAADAIGAESAGLQGVWLDNEGKVYPADLPPPRRTASSLSEFLHTLPLPLKS
ncbi:MAG TPA: HAD family hydrolase [Candidatus Baltobacteraceae bacterium]|nr:HAD family hydrolase [Candidatus Baltobacteraceae bacterium]